MGVTGSSTEAAINGELPDILKRVRRHATVPLAVGFGVATREHFGAVRNAGADGVVIGSRIVSIIKSSPLEDVANSVERYCTEITQKAAEGKGPSARNGRVVNGKTSLLPAWFGEFGGQYVPGTLVDCLFELEAAHKFAIYDESFWREFRGLFGYMNRPSTLYLSDKLTKHTGGARIWLKREDL